MTILAHHNRPDDATRPAAAVARSPPSTPPGSIRIGDPADSRPRPAPPGCTPRFRRFLPTCRVGRVFEAHQIGLRQARGASDDPDRRSRAGSIRRGAPGVESGGPRRLDPPYTFENPESRATPPFTASSGRVLRAGHAPAIMRGPGAVRRPAALLGVGGREAGRRSGPMGGVSRHERRSSESWVPLTPPRASGPGRPGREGQDDAGVLPADHRRHRHRLEPEVEPRPGHELRRRRRRGHPPPASARRARW